MTATFGLPPELVAHVRAFTEQPHPPARAKPAATTMLLRDTDAGLEVYLLRRHAQMPFAAGMYAFPGGRVDPRDADTTTAWTGPTPAQWGLRLSCDAPTAQALVCAAVRETFEESGVLLAGPTPDTVVTDTTGPDWERERRELVDRSLAFAALLARRELVLRSDLLGAWAHWITPSFEPRRYDTRFFVALLPAGQRARDVSGEADHVIWMRPATAVAGVDSGELAMLPPTYCILRELAASPTAADVLAAAADRTITAIEPSVRLEADGAFLELPKAAES